MNDSYLRTARLLTQVAPSVFVDETFALKGGTAINLFYRDMPRLSVDLDLVFRDYAVPRTEAVAQIDTSVRAMAERLRARGFRTSTPLTIDSESKLVIRRDDITVKVEVNTVMRGTVSPIRIMAMNPHASDVLKADLELPITSFEDTYGGKLAAALDRQHPRDLFDVLQLFEHEGITPAVRRAFVVHVASHNRPVHELLYPMEADIQLAYTGSFAGMTRDPVPLGDLLATRTRMIREIQAGLDVSERTFLLSLVAGEQDVQLAGVPHVSQLPGVRWKRHNLEQLRRTNPSKFAEQHAKLAVLFEAG